MSNELLISRFSLFVTTFITQSSFAQSAGAVEYTDWTFAEG